MKTIDIPQDGAHGGAMTPRAPSGVKGMQEFTAYVVVDEQGAADRSTIARSKAASLRLYFNEDLPLAPKRERELTAELKRSGLRIARCAVAEDA